MFRENADSKAASDTQRVVLNYKFGGHCIREPFRRDCSSEISSIFDYDEKFVSAQPGDRVLFTRPFSSAVRNLLQEKVADRMSE